MNASLQTAVGKNRKVAHKKEAPANRPAGPILPPMADGLLLHPANGCNTVYMWVKESRVKTFLPTDVGKKGVFSRIIRLHELQEILMVSRSTVHNLLKKKELKWGRRKDKYWISQKIKS